MADLMDLQSKAMEALKAVIEWYLQNQGETGLTVLVGLDGRVDLQLPRVECKAEQGEEEPPETGNFWVGFTVMIYSTSNGADALTTHRGYVAKVGDAALLDQIIARNLSEYGIEGFCVLGVKNKKIIDCHKTENHFESGFAFDAYCAPFDYELAEA